MDFTSLALFLIVNSCAHFINTKTFDATEVIAVVDVVVIACDDEFAFGCWARHVVGVFAALF